jgi:hypothetical protein
MWIWIDLKITRWEAYRRWKGSSESPFGRPTRPADAPTTCVWLWWPWWTLALTNVIVATPCLQTGVEFEDFDYHEGDGV